MRLRNKIVAGYCVVSCLTAMIGFFGGRAALIVDGEFQHTADENIPEVKALEDMKFAGVRIVSSVTEEVFLRHVSAVGRTRGRSQDKERGLIAEGKGLFREALGRYSKLSSHSRVESEESEAIRRAGERLVGTGDALLKLVNAGAPDKLVFEGKERFEEDESHYLATINRALDYEYRELKESRERVSRAISSATMTVGTLSFLVALIGLLIGRGQAAAIVRPLDRLKEDAERIGRGDLDTVIASGAGDEIGLLATSFDHMRCEVKETREQLLNARNELENIISSMLDSLVVISPEGVIRMVNVATCRMLDYERHELEGRDFDLILVGESDAPYCLAKLLEQRSCNCQELTYRKKDGSHVPVAFSGAALYTVGGSVQGYVCVALDITDRKEAEEQIRRINEELESRVAERTAQLTLAVSELEAFSYTVSHDLRSPLQTICGYSGLLMDTCSPKLDADEIDYLVRIGQAGQRMALFIDNMLDFATVCHGELRCREVDLSEMARSIAAELLLSDTGRHVSFRISDGMTTIGDPGLLQVVLTNLLGNAWKYTGKKTDAVIEFDRRVENGVTVFVVRDNGDGFDMSRAGSLFAPFQRLHRADQFEGNGIGLATVKRIVVRHGGAVWAVGRPGVGAAVYFILSPIGEDDIDRFQQSTIFPASG